MYDVLLLCIMYYIYVLMYVVMWGQSLKGDMTNDSREFPSSSGPVCGLNSC